MKYNVKYRVTAFMVERYHDVSKLYLHDVNMAKDGRALTTCDKWGPRGEARDNIHKVEYPRRRIQQNCQMWRYNKERIYCFLRLATASWSESDANWLIEADLWPSGKPFSHTDCLVNFRRSREWWISARKIDTIIIAHGREDCVTVRTSCYTAGTDHCMVCQNVRPWVSLVIHDHLPCSSWPSLHKYWGRHNSPSLRKSWSGEIVVTASLVSNMSWGTRPIETRLSVNRGPDARHWLMHLSHSLSPEQDYLWHRMWAMPRDNYLYSRLSLQVWVLWSLRLPEFSLRIFLRWRVLWWEVRGAFFIEWRFVRKFVMGTCLNEWTIINNNYYCCQFIVSHH